MSTGRRPKNGADYLQAVRGTSSSVGATALRGATVTYTRYGSYGNPVEQVTMMLPDGTELDDVIAVLNRHFDG
jgi:hypothetical protein